MIGRAFVEEEAFDITSITLQNGKILLRARGVTKYGMTSGEHVVALYDLNGKEVCVGRPKIDFPHQPRPGDIIEFSYELTITNVDGWGPIIHEDVA